MMTRFPTLMSFSYGASLHRMFFVIFLGVLLHIFRRVRSKIARLQE
ncbi:hypothetical protein Lser_V15G17610 [Lactuca serriola]